MSAKINKIRYCSLKPDYPNKAFIYLVFIRDEKLINVYAMPLIYSDLDDVCYAVEEFSLGLENAGMEIAEEVGILIPATLTKLYPLKRKFWRKPEIHYDVAERIKLFLRTGIKPEFYNLLVTPRILDEKGKWYLEATIPLIKGSNENIIERFLLSSDQPVDERAKFAAIYSLGNPLRFDWRTREILGADISEALGDLN